MNVTLCGTRGSMPVSRAEMARYGGNTSCVKVEGRGGRLIVLDAGTGIRQLGNDLDASLERIDIFLTHLHLDHIQGLGFFAPLQRSDFEVHIWGPPSTDHALRERIGRYLSPPLFPAHLDELPCRLIFHDAPRGSFELDLGGVDRFTITADYVAHAGLTYGYRVAQGGCSLAFLPDHQPAQGEPSTPWDETWRSRRWSRDWLSGADLAHGVDLLIHDAQYTPEEYEQRETWGHSSIDQTMIFADLLAADRLVTFHHDPEHTDSMLDQLIEDAVQRIQPSCVVHPGLEGQTFALRPVGDAGDVSEPATLPAPRRRDDDRPGPVAIGAMGTPRGMSAAGA